MTIKDLPTMAEVAAARPLGCPKDKSRLQEKVAEKKLDLIDDKKFKALVWARDKKQCRKCHRKVRKTIDRIPERGEVHHLHGRVGVFEFDDHHALLLCLGCHEQLTGRVSEKWIATQRKAQQVFVAGQWCIDARHAVKFERVI